MCDLYGRVAERHSFTIVVISKTQLYLLGRFPLCAFDRLLVVYCLCRLVAVRGNGIAIITAARSVVFVLVKESAHVGASFRDPRRVVAILPALRPVLPVVADHTADLALAGGAYSCDLLLLLAGREIALPAIIVRALFLPAVSLTWFFVILLITAGVSALEKPVFEGHDVPGLVYDHGGVLGSL